MSISHATSREWRDVSCSTKLIKHEVAMKRQGTFSTFRLLIQMMLIGDLTWPKWSRCIEYPIHTRIQRLLVNILFSEHLKESEVIYCMTSAIYLSIQSGAVTTPCRVQLADSDLDEVCDCPPMTDTSESSFVLRKHSLLPRPPLDKKVHLTIKRSDEKMSESERPKSRTSPLPSGFTRRWDRESSVSKRTIPSSLLISAPQKKRPKTNLRLFLSCGHGISAKLIVVIFLLQAWIRNMCNWYHKTSFQFIFNGKCETMHVISL
jgi:hypothetical protein